ncbi:MAG TPA: LemA family protein [Thiobacillaceae bacterium]|nr:LemA family protein [Thiobacillaceae bacterium]
MTTAILTLGLLAILLIYGISVFNSLVQIKHNVAQAWSNIDVLLKQRHDELPKLVETCRQYKQFEQDTLTRVTEARARVQQAREAGDIPALGLAETALRGGLGQIFATVEAYPELKSSEHFRELMTRVTGLENAIADRRELYNESVNINNVRIEQFPDSIVAGMFHFPRRPLLRFGEEDKRDVDVKALFAS